MMKIKNKRIYSEDPTYLQRLADELVFLGRNFKLDIKNGVLTQLALPPQTPKKKVERSVRDEVEKEPRNKRAEAAARRAS